MKMKKIIALSVCAMMALSTVASAGYQVIDGVIAADKITAAEVLTRSPKANIDVTELNASQASAKGLSLGAFSNKLTDENSDFYQVDLTVNELGTLYYAYNIEGVEMQVRLNGITVQLPGVIVKKNATSSSFGGKAWSMSQPMNEDNLFSMYWNAGGAEETMYPTTKPDAGGAYIETPDDITATFIIAVDEGAKYENVTPTVAALYNVVNDTESAEPRPAGTGNKVTIAPAAPAATLDRVVISGETTGLKMGATETTTLTATAYNNDNSVNNAATIAWSVDNDVVTVNKGVVTAKKAGTATVTATAVDGGITKTAAVEITVAEADPIVVTPSIKVIGADQTEADPTAAPGTAATGTVDGKEVKGFVWPLVKLINFNAAGTYRATFTADDSETAERTFDFSGIEVGGMTDIEFAIVLNTNKTGVKLNMQYVAPSAE